MLNWTRVLLTIIIIIIIVPLPLTLQLVFTYLNPLFGHYIWDFSYKGKKNTVLAPSKDHKEPVTI